jgi:CDP-diacylglycerol--glycerol-3-phosphate 3-phosphatidyltransferase
LSTDYFTNRQDRYIKFGGTKQLSDYYCDMLETVGSFSYTLHPPASHTNSSAQYSLLLKDTADPVEHSLKFKSQAYQRMREFLSRHQNTGGTGSGDHDTVVYPIVQMAPLGIRQDEKATLRVLDIIHEHGKTVTQKDYWQIYLTSGYFNFTQHYKEMILRTAAKFEFLTASPKVKIHTDSIRVHSN